MSLLVKQVKKVFILSSVFFLIGIILMPSMAGGAWKPILALYFFVFSYFCVFAGREKQHPRGSPFSFSGEEKLS